MLLISCEEGFAGPSFLNMVDIAEALRQDGEAFIPPLGDFNTQPQINCIGVVFHSLDPADHFLFLLQVFSCLPLMPLFILVAAKLLAAARHIQVSQTRTSRAHHRVERVHQKQGSSRSFPVASLPPVPHTN
jgi:hypothetical protein